MEREWIAAAAGIIGALGAVVVQGLLGHVRGTSDGRESCFFRHIKR
jgi:hypothetical protein